MSGPQPLVIGAGNVASSIVYALTHAGLPVTIVDERIDRAIELVYRLRHVMDEHSFSVYRWPQDMERVASTATLIINATTSEDWSNAQSSPWPDGLPFPADALVFDLEPTSSDSRFIRQARTSGARTVSGLHLLVNETAVVLERWTGYRPSIEVMWRVARKTLSRHMLGALALPKAPEPKLVNPAPVPGAGD